MRSWRFFKRVEDMSRRRGVVSSDGADETSDFTAWDANCSARMKSARAFL